MKTTARILALLTCAITICPALAQDSKPADSPPSSTPGGAPSGAPADPKGAPPAKQAPELEVLPETKIQADQGDLPRMPRIGFAKGLQYRVVRSWKTEAPTNSMRIAQFRIPAPTDSGLAEGSLVVSGGIGGSAEDNAARWAGQFTEIQGKATMQKLLVNNLQITQVIITGTYNPGMNAPNETPTLNTTLFGAIVEGGPEGAVFFKATGPKDTMLAARTPWDMLIRNTRVAPAEQPK